LAVKIQAIRGMHDILPESTPVWQYIEDTIRHILVSYGYREIRMPIVEKTELFKRSIGEVTDIVEKEMYSFEDRNAENLTLRPEGTAGCVRATLENGLLHNQTQKLWYMGPMFRHERPQKGRYRQFHQIGVECFGMPGPDVDAEHIFMTARMWDRLGLSDIQLQINSLGSNESRAKYRDILVSYFSEHPDSLDEDSQRRLHTNPMRILDSKNPDMKELIDGAPVITDHLDDESKQHFDELLSLLDATGIKYEINSRLVRGLDYYCKTVYEWVTHELGAQGTICAGGRFDGLVEQLGGKATTAAGFALGIERLVSLLENSDRKYEHGDPHAYLIMSGDNAMHVGFRIAEQLRNELPELRLAVNCGGGSFKSQFKKADKSGAAIALILGDEELDAGNIAIKPLRQEGEQVLVSQEELAEYLSKNILM
jgi:histidyl-tRNA synthetase